jgi:4-amino-4-deoxy-L-arabinose transferase-like glycosyltransferase
VTEGPGETGGLREGLWLVLILAIGLALRLWLVPGRWVNPDEGAHLMDGRLVLHGLLPVVDFDARQVLYTYILAGLIAVLGPSYQAVRVVVAIVTIVGALLVYLLSRRLFDRQVAIVAALIYAFLPLGVIWAPVVHTEPWAVLFGCMAIYMLAGTLDAPPRPSRWAAAGLFLGLAFYIRESSLGLVAGAALWMGLRFWREPAELARRSALLAAGFLVPCVLVAAAFIPRLGFAGWWASPLNPVSLPLHQIGAAIHTVGGGSASVADTLPPASRLVARGDQPWGRTLHYFKTVFGYNAILAAGVLASLAFLGVRRGKTDAGIVRERRGLTLLLCWLGGVGLAYLYWALHRGFFPQYAEELLPALAILLAWSVVRLLGWWGHGAHAVPLAAAFALYLGAVFWLYGRARPLDLPGYAGFLIPALALALLQVPAPHRFRRWLAWVGLIAIWLAVATFSPLPVPLLRLLKLTAIPLVFLAGYVVSRDAPAGARRSLAAYGACCLLLVLGEWTFRNAGRLIDRKYETVWTPGSVREVADLLKSHSEPGDEVMSGAVIWEFQADRRPIANISHPLGFLIGMLPSQVTELETLLATRPPRFIVLDGYTEQTYGANLPDFDRLLAERYSLDLTIEGSYYPVKVYGLTQPPSSQPGAGPEARGSGGGATR